jgi:hypothetical protein
MAKLTRDDLYSLEDYAQMRDDFRAKVMTHKKDRRLELGENIVLHFEDQLIMHYQVQEMLRAEKIFEARGIEDELNAYNPLIPDGTNFKATMMIQYSDIDERKIMLEKLVGIDDLTWLQVNGFDKVFAISDEDMDRATETKTSAVHFLRFELTPEMTTALKEGATLDAGIDHDSYPCSIHPVTTNITASLVEDLE